MLLTCLEARYKASSSKLYNTVPDDRVIVTLLWLPRAQGQFAFAAYDAEKKQVFAARDSSGKEQLFYSFGEDGVSFANKPLSAPGLEETWRELLPGACTA